MRGAQDSDRPETAVTTSSGSAPLVDHARTTPACHRIPDSRLARYGYLTAGWCCVGLAFLGAFLPLLPTTPFLLPASYCFLRSSPRLHAWLRASRTFGPFLRDWEELGGVRPGVKILAISVVVVTVVASLMSGRLPPMGYWVLPPLALAGIVVVLRLKTVRPVGPPPSPSDGIDDAGQG